MRLIVFILIVANWSYPANATEQIIVGRWCHTMGTFYTQEIKVSIEGNGEVIMRSRFNDGSSMERKLIELPNSIYKLAEQESDVSFRIVKATGELQLLDSDGLIGTAKRLENIEKPKDCVK